MPHLHAFCTFLHTLNLILIKTLEIRLSLLAPSHSTMDCSFIHSYHFTSLLPHLSLVFIPRMRSISPFPHSNCYPVYSTVSKHCSFPLSHDLKNIVLLTPLIGRVAQYFQKPIELQHITCCSFNRFS